VDGVGDTVGLVGKEAGIVTGVLGEETKGTLHAVGNAVQSGTKEVRLFFRRISHLTC